MKTFVIKQDYIVLAGLMLLFAGLAWLVSISTGTEGGEDSFQHFQIARYAFKHPGNLLDHWGKPIHTLLLAPFAQFGFTGAKIYSSLAAVFAAFFTYKTADRLGLKTAMGAIIVLIFAPLYFLCINSALTEVTFSLLLAAGVYFFVAEKYYTSAIILSLLPFARSEGFILLAFSGLFFLRQKKFIPFLFLGFGTVVYSIIGYFYFHDILWVFSQNPYSDKIDAYPRSKNFWAYVDAHRLVLGEPGKWLFIIGFLSYLFSTSRARLTGDKTIIHWNLAAVLVLAFFFAHSIVWHYGLMGSAGLSRVFASISPLMALFCTRGLEVIYRPFVFNPNLRLAVICTILAFVVQYLFGNYKFPVQLGQEETTLYDAGNWYKQSPYYNPDNKVYYFAPTVSLAFDVDPFDPAKRSYLEDAKKSHGVPAGSIVVYDMHFGPNECHYPLEEIQADTAYRLIHRETPQHPFTTAGGFNYEVFIFRRK